jgi:anti-repressor protein
MHDLITIAADKPFPVDARDLHMQLGVGRDFSTWIKDRIERFQFSEFADYASFDSPDLGNQTGRGGDRRSIGYSLTVSAAKMIAAVENTPTGREVLQHLVKVEAAWNAPEMVLVRAQQAAQVIIERMKVRIAELEPDAAAARVIACADGRKSLSDVGKINGIGPRKIFDLLADRGILFRRGRDWVPYQQFIDSGYFIVRESTYEVNGIDHLYSKTYVTGKGELWLAKQLFTREEIA